MKIINENSIEKLNFHLFLEMLLLQIEPSDMFGGGGLEPLAFCVRHCMHSNENAPKSNNEILGIVRK